LIQIEMHSYLYIFIYIEHIVVLIWYNNI